MPLLDAVLLVALFVPAWAGLCWLLARVGGWRTLAEHYAQGDRSFRGETRWMRRLSLGPLANYGNCLVAGRGPEGIRLALLPLVPVAHPALLIPWSDVAPPTIRGMGPFRTAEFRFARAPGVRVRVRASLAAWLLAGRSPATLPPTSKKALDRLGANP